MTNIALDKIVDNEDISEYEKGCDPETGEGVNNPGFQNWNLLVVNMISWLKH